MATVTPRKAVWRHLIDDSGVSSLVDDRIYYQVRPDGAVYPCIVIAAVSDVPRRDLRGVAWREARLQITVMAETQSAAEAVAEAVQLSLEGFSGRMAGALDVMDCRVVSASPLYQEESGQTHYHVDVVLTHFGGAYNG